MDFRQSNQSSSRPASTPAVASTPADAPKKASTTAPVTPSGSTGGKVRWLSILTVVVVFGISALLALLAFGFAHSSSPLESKLVDTKKYQAVFLNNGQVYFGNITSLNKQYVRLNNIYYLTQTGTTTTNGQTATDGNYTLQKLGCQQIHDPYDQMVINRDQVTFWENLNDGGQVVTKIKEFQKQNPNGPDCSQVSNQTQASDTTQAQGGAANTTTTGTDSTTKKQ